MKGQAGILEVVGMVALIVILIFFFVVIMPDYIMDVYRMLALASAEVVSRDLAGLITISGAAPDQMTINYNAYGEGYVVDIDNRIVSVHLLTGLKDIATGKTAVDGLKESFEDVNRFEIEKWREEGVNKYDVEASKEE